MLFRSKMKLFKNSVTADPEDFSISRSIDFLPHFQALYVTVEYDDLDDFAIEFNDGRHQFYQLSSTLLPQEDVNRAMSLIIENMRQVRKQYIKDSKTWGAV